MDETPSPGCQLRNSFPVFINISGLKFETRSKTLNRYPDTLLGDDTKLLKFFCSHRKEYFFNRHRECFTSILFFYQSFGKLYRPYDVNLKVFLEECEFFQLPQWAIDHVKKKEGGFLQDEILEFLNAKPEEEQEVKSIVKKLWNFIDNPTSTKYARWFCYFNVCLLCSSIIINSLKTVKSFRSATTPTHRHDGWEIADITINSYFLVEFILRVISSPRKTDLFKSYLAWIDFIALVTFIPLLNKHYTSDSVILFFTPFQLFRAIRIFRVAKLMPGFNITEIILKDCMWYLQMFLTWLLFFSATGAVWVFTVEEDEKDTQFTSIPESLYWAIQTAVTLGYGDIVPSTICGKLIASCFIICFIPTLCLPTLAILVRFSMYYEFFQAANE